MDNVIDFESFKKLKKIVKLTPSEIKEDCVVVSPEQLRKIAFSMEQMHFEKVKIAQETMTVLPDYEVGVKLFTANQLPVNLIWYPLR